MKLCSHLKEKFGVGNEYEAHMLMSDGYCWNGWLEEYEGNNLIYSTFVTGGMWTVVEHARNCKEYSSNDRRWAKQMLKEMQKEWKSVMG